MYFSVYDIRDCLYDEKRTGKFAEAIKAVVKKGDIVVDAGSGSGILALLALKAGAKRAYAIELSKRHGKIIENNARINGFSKKLKVICADARFAKLPEKVDVIICELIHTGTFFEPEMQVIENLKKYLKPNGKITPQTLYSYIELADAKEKFYDIKLSYDSRPDLGEKILSERRKFDLIRFENKEPIELKTIVKLKAGKNGFANAVKITGRLKLSEGNFLGKSKHILMPEIIFLKNPFRVSRGKDYFLQISYSGGADTTDVKINKISKVTPSLLKKCNWLPDRIL